MLYKRSKKDLLCFKNVCPTFCACPLPLPCDVTRGKTHCRNCVHNLSSCGLEKGKRKKEKKKTEFFSVTLRHDCSTLSNWAIKPTGPTGPLLRTQCLRLVRCPCSCPAHISLVKGQWVLLRKRAETIVKWSQEFLWKQSLAWTPVL